MIKVILSFTLLFGMIITVVGCDESNEIYHTCLGAADEQEGLVTTTVGITGYDEMYELGTVLVNYFPTQVSTTRTSKTQIAVHDFLIKKGYTPKVKGVIHPYTELIDIGEGTDPLPLLEEIESIEGVYWAYLNSFHDAISSSEYTVPSQTKKGLIEVGVTEDGDLYELGVVWVHYNETTQKEVNTGASVPAVNNFFINKGYTPKRVTIFASIEAIEIDECVDTLPMLEELKSIPGVVDVYLNILTSKFKVRSGKLISH